VRENGKVVEEARSSQVFLRHGLPPGFVFFSKNFVNFDREAREAMSFYLLLNFYNHKNIWKQINFTNGLPGGRLDNFVALSREFSVARSFFYLLHLSFMIIKIIKIGLRKIFFECFQRWHLNYANSLIIYHKAFIFGSLKYQTTVFRLQLSQLL
jgi:hypothetical protein